ncbi:hypothetical protein [Nocardia takedensis]|uniref:hypothetical protein n=1 Tax=Nocardia takedensis TaxID=259390 RepID=UPI0012F6E2A1|nr:hypothetical protein [Nocardia takedensis]
MAELRVECGLPDVELSVADEQCADVYDSLAAEAPELPVLRTRGDELSQDFGAALVIVRSAPRVVASVREPSTWLARRHDAQPVLRRIDTTGARRELKLVGLSTAQGERMVSEFITDPPSR